MFKVKFFNSCLQGKESNFVFVCCIVLSVCFQFCACSTSARGLNYCGADASPTGILKTYSLNWIPDVVTKLKETIDDLLKIKEIYGAKLVNIVGRKSIIKCLQKGYFHLPWFPSIDSAQHGNKHQTIKISDDYFNLQTILDILYRVINHEETRDDIKEEGLRLINKSFLKIQDVLCDLRINRDGQSLQQDVPTEDVMNYSIPTERLERFEQHFRVFRDTITYIKSMSVKYFDLYFSDLNALTNT